MLVRLYVLDEVLGDVRLVDGQAVPDETVADLLDGVIVVDPQRYERVSPHDGIRYLRWLPESFSGSHVRARLLPHDRLE